MEFKLKKIIAGALVAASLAPVLAFAEDATGGAPSSPDGVKTTVVSTTDFCARLSTLQTKITDQIKATEDKQSTNESARLAKVAQKESDADAKRAQGRSDVDAKRLSNWTRMSNKAKTDAQKAAVEAYKTAIQSAVTTRRASVDAAVKAYRDALTAALTTHTGSIATAMTTFKASVDAAFTKAQADCAAKVASKTVKATFNKSVSDARKVLQAAKKAASDASGLKALRQTRDDAVKAAEAAFKQATDKAHADLILALK